MINDKETMEYHSIYEKLAERMTADAINTAVQESEREIKAKLRQTKLSEMNAEVGVSFLQMMGDGSVARKWIQREITGCDKNLNPASKSSTHISDKEVNRESWVCQAKFRLDNGDTKRSFFGTKVIFDEPGLDEDHQHSMSAREAIRICPIPFCEHVIAPCVATPVYAELSVPIDKTEVGKAASRYVVPKNGLWKRIRAVLGGIFHPRARKQRTVVG